MNGIRLADLRYGLRQLVRRPGYTAAAVLALALGIGGTIALLSVTQGLLLKPLPFRDESRLMVFWSASDWRQSEFDFAQERLTGYEAVAAYAEEAAVLRTEQSTQKVDTIDASAELFDVLGRQPLLGRGFKAGDDRPGAERVVVLSHALWQTGFGGSPAVLGTLVNLDGTPTRVVGVMGPDFYFPTPLTRAWRPLRIDPAQGVYDGNGYLTLLGRLKADVAPQAIDQHTQAFAAALGTRFEYPPMWDKTKGAHVKSLREALVGDVRPALTLLLGTVALLLLMACANVSALVMSRTLDRIGEFSVRSALGATRGRQAAQLVAESLLLAVLAGVVAVLFALAAYDLLLAALPLRDGLAAIPGMDWSSFAAALGLALLAAFGISLLPIRRVLAGESAGALRGARSSSGAATARPRASAAMIGLEVALAVVLVTGAALLVRTVVSLQTLDTGMRSEGVVTMTLVMGEAEMDEAARRGFVDALLQGAAALPGVGAAGVTNRLPIRDPGWQGPVAIDGRGADAERPNVVFRTASPDYFRAMGITLLEGRGIEASDHAEALPVAVVTERFARTVWPGESALGKRFEASFDGPPRLVTVIGVAKEVRMFNLVGENPFVMFAPQAQMRSLGNASILAVRSASEPGVVAPALRELVRGLDPRVAVADIKPMDAVIADAMREPLRLRFFLGLFALLALVLGVVGIYGVVSHSVAQRRAEFGIRMALGATSRNVVSRVLRDAMRPVLIGVVAGGLVALGAAQLLARFLFGVTPTDGISMLAAVATLLGAAAVAAFIPALRASRVPPVLAIRAE